MLNTFSDVSREDHRLQRRKALLRRRYDAVEHHIECLLLQVNDVPPLTDTLLRTVCKNAQTTIVI